MAQQRLEYHQIIRTHLRTAYLLPEEKIDSVLPRFLDSLQNLMLNLERVAATETEEALGRAGHAIKGALLNLGLRELAAIAFLLEKNGRSPDLQRDSAALIANLKAELSKII